MFQSAFDNSEGGAVSRILVKVHPVYVSKKSYSTKFGFSGFVDVEMNGWVSC